MAKRTRGPQEPVIAHLDQSCFKKQRNYTAAAPIEFYENKKKE
jgi:hypothetical protein